MCSSDLSDAGSTVCLGVGGSLVVPDLTFQAGNIVSVFNHDNNPSTIIFQLPAYVSGTPFVVVTLTIAPYGYANIWFYSPSLCVVSGAVS